MRLLNIGFNFPDLHFHVHFIEICATTTPSWKKNLFRFVIPFSYIKTDQWSLLVSLSILAKWGRETTQSCSMSRIKSNTRCPHSDCIHHFRMTYNKWDRIFYSFLILLGKPRDWVLIFYSRVQIIWTHLISSKMGLPSWSICNILPCFSLSESDYFFLWFNDCYVFTCQTSTIFSFMSDQLCDLPPPLVSSSYFMLISSLFQGGNIQFVTNCSDLAPSHWAVS